MPTTRPLHRRLAAAVTGLSLLVGSAGCSLLGIRDEDPPEPPRQGPAPRWTAEVPRAVNWAAVSGDTLVVSAERALLGLDLAAGTQRWHLGVAEGETVTIAGGSIVQRADNTQIKVIDSASGAIRWQDDRPGWRYVVRADGIYADDCERRPARSETCTIEARELADGKTRWTLPSAKGGVIADRIGARIPYAPESGRYLVAHASTGLGERLAQPIDRQTGRPLKGKIATHAWYTFAVGDLLVSTDHDKGSDSGPCTVAVNAVAAKTGAASWSSEIFSGTRADGKCYKWLANWENSPDLIGTDSTLAAVTNDGRPQVIDLTTGRAIWVGDTPGVPLDGDGRSLLLRQHADDGPLSLLDVGTGEVRWTAPNPGVSGPGTRWRSTVTARLAVYNGQVDGWRVAFVQDVQSGQQLARFRGGFVGAGDDWVAATRGDGSKSFLEFTRF